MLSHPKFYQSHKTWTAKDMPDALWPSDNDEGVPLLRLDLQADALDLPAVAWGSVKRTRPMTGTWHFYVDDYRFNHLWKDPSAVLNSTCVSIVEPNFSVGLNTPRAVALYQIYRKRWLARLWQEFRGIRVFVDLNVARRYAQENMLGVPEGWRAYATRGSSRYLDDLDFEYELACEKRGGDDILFAVYGGTREVKQHAQRRGWIWLAEQMDVAKGRVEEATDEQRWE